MLFYFELILLDVSAFVEHFGNAHLLIISRSIFACNNTKIEKLSQVEKRNEDVFLFERQSKKTYEDVKMLRSLLRLCLNWKPTKCPYFPLKKRGRHRNQCTPYSDIHEQIPTHFEQTNLL